MRRFTFLSSLSLALAALFLSGCGQPKVAGVYKTIGSEDKFQMTLELQEGGKARLSTKTNLGSKALDDTTALDDADTADLFTEVSRGVDKFLWMVEAHVQDTSAEPKPVERSALRGESRS